MALVGPQPEVAVTGRIEHLTKASTSANLTCPGKYQKYVAAKVL
ncbi:MAG: hypothetical protein ACK55I_10890 [bacterium]